MPQMRIIGAAAFAFLAGLPAYAACKEAPANYSIVDLGDFVDDQIEAKALAIGPDGRLIIRALGAGKDDDFAEFLREARGKYAPVNNADDGASRDTIDYLGNRLRLVEYTNIKPGYVPLELITLIDRRGAEMTVVDYCKPPSEEAVLERFVISPSGLKSAGLFATDDGPVVAKCVEDDSASVLFKAEAEETLVAINDAGQLAGLSETPGNTNVWRWTEGRRETGVFPENLSNPEIDGVDEDGNIYVTTTGHIKNQSLRYRIDGQIEMIEILPELGWDLDHQVLGQCGELFGRAFHTEFEAFLELPDEEQAAIRGDFERYKALASERELGLFVWSDDYGGRLLSDVVAGADDWIGIEILDINGKGQAVGFGATADGRIRALMFEPNRRR